MIFRVSVTVLVLGTRATCRCGKGGHIDVL